ncbi:MAG: WG repeat-containing protein [Bacteroidota bacterium]
MIKGKDPFVDTTNRVGFMDSTFRIIVPPIYNNCSLFKKGFAVVGRYANGIYLLGLINVKGKLVLPVQYHGISLCKNGLVMVYTGKYIGFADTTGKMIVPPEKYSHYAAFRADPVEGDDTPYTGFRWGNIPFGVNVPFSRYIGVQSGNKWAVIDSTGKEIIPPSFDGMEPFTGKLAPAKMNKKFGVININGRWLIQPLYDHIGIGKNVAYVTNGDKTGLRTLKGKPLIPITFASIAPFGEGYSALLDYYGDRAILFNGQGKRISDTTDYNRRNNFPVWGNESQGFWVYQKANKRYAKYQNAMFEETGRKKRWIYYQQHNLWGLMDTAGRELTPPEFDYIPAGKLDDLGGFDNPLIAVNKGAKWGVINRKGQLLLPTKYDDLFLYETRLVVKARGGWGVFSNRAHPLTKQNYDSIAIFRDGYYPNDYNGNNFFISGKLKGKWALLDTNRHQLTQPIYDRYICSYNGLGLVCKQGKYGLLNNRGRVVADCVYERIELSPNADNGYRYDGRILVQKDGYWGVINTDGKVVAPPVYDRIIKLDGRFLGKYQFTDHGKIGVFDVSAGKLIIPCVFNEIIFYRNYNTGNPSHYLSSFPYLIAQKGGNYGLIDTTGRVMLPFIYNTIGIYDDKNYAVSLNGGQGLLTQDLKMIILPKFSYIESDYWGMYIVHTVQGIGLISKDGDVVAEPIYKHFEHCGDYLIGEKDGKFGAIDKKGKVIKPFIYKKVTCEYGKLVVVP